jgi:hypothetical protein
MHLSYTSLYTSVAVLYTTVGDQWAANLPTDQYPGYGPATCSNWQPVVPPRPFLTTVQRTVLGYAPSPAIGPRHWIHVYPPSLLLYRDGDKARAGRCFTSTVLVSLIFGSYGQQWDVAGWRGSFCWFGVVFFALL